MASLETKKCPACDELVENAPVGGWFKAHSCPKATQPTDKLCPDCSAPTLWTTGPWSTYAACSVGEKYGGTCKGRFNAPRGSTAKKPAAQPTPAPASVAGDAAATLWALVGPAARAEIERVAREAAASAAAEVAGANVSIDLTVNGVEFAKIDAAHHMCAELCETVAAGFGNLLLVGPAGSGKTTLARDLAKSLGRPFAALSCTAGMSESKIEGRNVPKLATGEDVYSATEFTRLYQGGGVFLFDEVDAADPNVLLVVNAALANGHMSTPGGEIKRHDEFVLVCAANTYGLGADRVYVGRNQLDGAFLDRFVGATFDVDYDRKLESRILTDAGALAKVWSIREKVAELKIRRIVGTRFVLAVAKHMNAGKSLDAAIGKCVTGWSTEDKTRAGV